MSNKILIADDSQGWLKFHTTALKEFYGETFAVETADCARKAYDMVYNNLSNPYKVIITDLQMELDYEPLHAGEWLVEQVQKLSQYKNTSIIMVSATFNIKHIAEKYNCNFLPKSVAVRSLVEYKMLVDELLKR